MVKSKTAHSTMSSQSMHQSIGVSASVSKRVLSCKTFHMGTHFHINGFALDLTETQKASRNWPIKLDSSLIRFYNRLQANCGSLADFYAVFTF